MNSSPPEIGMMIYKTIYKIAHIEDPFKHSKVRCTQEILSIYPELERRVHSSSDPLYTALKYAGLANAIDYGANPEFELQNVIEQLDNKDFDVCHYELFRNKLSKTNQILYIADNAGETVFDRLLIKNLNKQVTYAVRSAPIINDATMDDALSAGVDTVARVISSGCDAPGVVLASCSEEFTTELKHADLIISKGQGNYETLSGHPYPIFFLLKVKCSVVARELGANTGSLIFTQSFDEK